MGSDPPPRAPFPGPSRSVALFVAGETLFSRQQVAEGTKGRPEIVPALPLAGGVLASAVLIFSESDIGSRVGLVLAMASVGGLGATYVKRFVDTEHDPLEWPGPKAWPGFGVFASWMAFLAATQSFAAIQAPY